MRPFAKSLIFVGLACSLNGCVAAVVPLAAAGVIGKKHFIDPKKRAIKAQAGLTARPASAPAQEIIATAPASFAMTQEQSDPSSMGLPAAADAGHPYALMVQYALEQVAARAAGDEIRSAILVEGVSLTKPSTVPCADKPMAVIIDVDTAVGAGRLTQSGLATLLDRLRSADIRIAWIGEGSIASIEETLTQPNVAEYSLLSQRDDILSAPAKGPRKQEQRWAFAKGHCVLAAAGDQQSDFDELFDYLQDPSYAAPLEIFKNRGWFLLPSPLRVNVENAP